MNHWRISWIFLFALAFLFACKTEKSGTTTKVKTDKSDPVLLTFSNGKVVTKSEFEYVYQKNNGGWEDAKADDVSDYKEYLDLYINFKRKVMEAEEKGLHETQAFKSEFEQYRAQLARPYLVDKEVEEKMIREAYERSKYLVNASHILFRLDPEAPPADTLRAYQRAMAVRDSILKGASFDEMAARHSADPSAATNKGNLGYFSVFDMIYPFETGAFNTGVGKISMPVRTGYGYHLIKVIDKVEQTGKKSVSHIIIRVGPQYSAKDSTQAVKKINEIYEQLKSGADFAELAAQYSDDPTTKNTGGNLGQGRLIPEMEDIKRTLDEGEISKPFETAFGWHILKVTDVEALKTFEESKPEIKSRIARDLRATISREKLIERIKAENNLVIDKEGLMAYMALIDDSMKYAKGFWRPDSNMIRKGDEVLYTIGKGVDKQTGTFAGFNQWYLRARKGYDMATLQQVVEKNFDLFLEDEMLRFEQDRLPAKYPEYKALLKEYRDGILLFTLTEDMVWKKAVEDTTGLKAFYETNPDLFKAGERIRVTEYISAKPEVLDQAMKYIKEGKSDKEIDSLLNQSSSLNISIRSTTYEKGVDELPASWYEKAVNYMAKMDGSGNNQKILVIDEKIPAGIKALKDAKPEAITQYQNYLETKWLEELEEKYPVEINESVLQSLFE